MNGRFLFGIGDMYMEWFVIVYDIEFFVVDELC